MICDEVCLKAYRYLPKSFRVVGDGKNPLKSWRRKLQKAAKQKTVIEESQPKKETVSSQKPSKRPYSTPRLVVYGKLSDITRSLGSTGVSDGGVAPMNRTSA
jgi:hypothetical protein